ncbi:MAG: hypothetical protein KJO44_08900 [Gemmatimonadetes bacterium]|nr:hypothetical protein [Gemmatimonadota bacterium]
MNKSDTVSRGAIGAALLALPWLFTPPAAGDASGLNNIPTADTTPAQTVVFQFKSVLSDETQSQYYAGFKMGLEPIGQRFEWGVDGKAGESSLGDDAGPAVLQFKLALDLTDTTALGLGVANIGVRSRDREDVGQPFKYAVLSHDFTSFRAHAGYALQQDGNTVLLGLDTTVELFDRDLTLRTDLIQIDDEDQWLGSLGFIYSIDDRFALESWVSQPFEHGEPSFTIKLNLVIPF